MLDLGKPLEAEAADRLLLPGVPGLEDGADPRLRAIVISHGHIDHWGLVPLAHTNIPVAMGAATRRRALIYVSSLPRLRDTDYTTHV